MWIWKHVLLHAHLHQVLWSTKDMLWSWIGNVQWCPVHLTCWAKSASFSLSSFLFCSSSCRCFFNDLTKSILCRILFSISIRCLSSSACRFSSWINSAIISALSSSSVWNFQWRFWLGGMEKLSLIKLKEKKLLMLDLGWCWY